MKECRMKSLLAIGLFLVAAAGSGKEQTAEEPQEEIDKEYDRR